MLTEMQCLAARLAAERGYSEADLKALSNGINDIDKAQKNKQKDAWADAMISLKNVLVELSANERIATIVTNSNNQLRRVWQISLRLDSIQEQSIDSYRALHDAILTGKAQEADKIQRLHCEHNREFLMNAIKKSGLKRV